MRSGRNNGDGNLKRIAVEIAFILPAADELTYLQCRDSSQITHRGNQIKNTTLFLWMKVFVLILKE